MPFPDLEVYDVARTREIPGSTKFAAVPHGALSFTTTDRDLGKVWKKTSREAGLRPGGGTSKISPACAVFQLTKEEIEAYTAALPDPGAARPAEASPPAVAPTPAAEVGAGTPPPPPPPVFPTVEILLIPNGEEIEQMTLARNFINTVGERDAYHVSLIVLRLIGQRNGVLS